MRNLNDYAKECHIANMRWWQDPRTGAPIQRNYGELIALCEVVDCLIRLFDLAGALGYDLESAYQEKMEYNLTRTDHTHQARTQPGGKSY